MPNPKTFSIKPISDLLDRWLPSEGVIIDPFAKDSLRGTIRNDLDPAFTDSHQNAADFCRSLHTQADAVLFDPPYSPRQISESYKAVGLAVGMKETQNGRFYKEVRDALDVLLKPGGIAISCGWNSAGFGKVRGYEMLEILLVAHGGAHNDTIVVVERKIR
jgi:hypothetical protein